MLVNHFHRSTVQNGDDDDDINNYTAPNDTTSSTETDDEMSESITLGSFCTEILSKIFEKMDDNGLLQLSNTCRRFEAIALAVIQKRYADNYFNINSTLHDGDAELYSTILKCFGKFVKSIQVNCVEGIDSDHWTMKILHEHINRIEKLTFQSCHFKSSQIFSRPADNLTHLIFRNDAFPGSAWTRSHNSPIDLPECHKLIKLKVDDEQMISPDSLDRIIRNNGSTLRSLVLNHHFQTLTEGITFYADHLQHIKEFSLNGFRFDEWSILSQDEKDKLSICFQNMESLILCINSNTIEFLQHLGNKCKYIKYLKVNYVDSNLDSEIVKAAVWSFQQIETLHWLEQPSYIGIKSLINKLPHLRHLYLNTHRIDADLYSDMVASLRICPILEKITITHEEWLRAPAFTLRLYKEFIGIIIAGEEPNSRIQVEYRNQILGSISKNGLSWRNKLLHWMGCDSILNSSSVHLLELANQLETRNAAKSISLKNRKNLLDRIFDYLDVSSLSAFAETNMQSKELMEKYVLKHTRLNGTFTITDEFDSLLETAPNYHQFFGILHDPYILFDPLVIKLNVEVYRDLSIFRTIIDNCRGLNVLPKVRHIVLESFDYGTFLGLLNYFELNDLFTQVKIIECKNVNEFEIFRSEKRIASNFRGLKVIFKYHQETRLKMFRKLFENTYTELVPILQSFT